MQRTDANMERIQTLVYPDQRLGVGLIAEEGNGSLFREKYLNSGIKIRFFTLTMALNMIR
jgi:hypothetical protein